MPPPSTRSLVVMCTRSWRFALHSCCVRVEVWKLPRVDGTEPHLSNSVCICVCVCVRAQPATHSEWTITKNLLNSRCSRSATICLSSISSFHSQMQRYGAFRVSVSNLTNSPPPVTSSDWNAGASCHSCHRRAGLVSRSFHQTTGAYIQLQRLMHYTFTSCLISASPPGSATARITCVSSICHIGASLEKMDESEMSGKVCLKEDSSGNLKLIFLTHLFQAVGVWRFDWCD